MTEKIPNPDRMESNEIETTQVGGKIYEIENLRAFAENIPITELTLDRLEGAVGEGHVYWIDREGRPLAPFQIISDWEAAQQTESWADHVESIKRANLADPIWMTREGHIFNGIHRLARAVIERRPSMKVRIFENLPDSARVRD
jgi:hypothetical protein